MSRDVARDGRQPVTQALCDCETIAFIRRRVYRPERRAPQFVEFILGNPADESDALANAEALRLGPKCVQLPLNGSGEDDERPSWSRELREGPKRRLDALVGTEGSDDK